MTTMSTTTRRVEIVGVLDPRWAEQTGQPRAKLIGAADRFADGREDPFELARYWSSGYDTGAADFSPDTGGGTMVRDHDTGEILARYVNGRPASAEEMPFLVSPDGHWPAWAKLTRGGGMRTVIGCQCGWKPAKPSTRASTQHVSHAAHRRRLGLQPVEYRWPDDADGVAGALSTGPLVRVRGHVWRDGGWVKSKSRGGS
jgi:hypothetical protein